MYIYIYVLYKYSIFTCAVPYSLADSCPCVKGSSNFHVATATLVSSGFHV